MKRTIFLWTHLLLLGICSVWFTFWPLSRYWFIGIPMLAVFGGIEYWVSKKITLRIRDYGEKLGKQKNDYKKLGYELNVASSQVSSVSQNLYLNLEENTAFTQQLFAQTEEMTSLNTSVTANITETIASIKKVLEVLEKVEHHTSHLKELSITSSDVINNSLVEIMEILNTIHDIQASSDATLTNMNKLNQTSKQILNILDTVSSISDQTHLLALNASIESARAGEAGKGFAVVADEIRKLSMSTSDAVKDVSTLIDSIQNELAAVNKQVEDNSKKVESGVVKSKTVENSLEKVKLSFNKVVQLVEDIAKLSAEEMHLTKGVDSSISKVEYVVDQTADSVEAVFNSVNKQKESMEDIADMSARLNEASATLSLLVEDYKFDAFSAASKDRVAQHLDSFKKIVSELSSDMRFAMLDKAVHQQHLKNLIEKHPFIEAIWTNGHKGRFVVSIPPAGIANGSVREWFKKSIAGEYYVSEPYISAITRTPCMTLSAPIIEPSGHIRGVIGIDIKLGEE